MHMRIHFIHFYAVICCSVIVINAFISSESKFLAANKCEIQAKMRREKKNANTQRVHSMSNFCLESVVPCHVVSCTDKSNVVPYAPRRKYCTQLCAHIFLMMSSHRHWRAFDGQKAVKKAPTGQTHARKRPWRNLCVCSAYFLRSFFRVCTRVHACSAIHSEFSRAVLKTNVCDS